jgi:hypothetical protein
MKKVILLIVISTITHSILSQVSGTIYFTNRNTQKFISLIDLGIQHGNRKPKTNTVDIYYNGIFRETPFSNLKEIRMRYPLDWDVYDEGKDPNNLYDYATTEFTLKSGKVIKNHHVRCYRLKVLLFDEFSGKRKLESFNWYYSRGGGDDIKKVVFD